MMTRPTAQRAILLALALLCALPAAAAAADRDGMPDRWERRYGLSVRVNDARRDADGDRLTNVREYLSRTNPRRADTDRDGVADGADALPRRAQRGRRANTRRPGSPILSDREAAARVRRSAWEPRPQNRLFNLTVPTAGQLRRFIAGSSAWGSCDGMRRRITGNFTGTTDEIIQWAAWKWGIDEDVLRAKAALESYWKQNALGNGGYAHGLMQVHRQHHPAAALLAARSTAFNVDYYTGYMRYHFDGCARWLNDKPRAERYRAGDLWGSVLAWCSGSWWRGCDGYIGNIRRYLLERRWRSRWF